MSRSQRRRDGPVRRDGGRERRTYRRDRPAPRCPECGCPDRTHSREGPVCDACAAPWPVYAVDVGEGP